MKILAMTISSIVATSLVLFSLGLASEKAEKEEKERHRREEKEEGHKREERGLRKIQHIVYIIKENRTFDNYFGKFPGAEGATSGTISTGKVIPLGQAPDRTPRDIAHSWQAALTAMDGGKMDQFDLIGGGNQIQIILLMRAILFWRTICFHRFMARVSLTIFIRLGLNLEERLTIQPAAVYGGVMRPIPHAYR